MSPNMQADLILVGDGSAGAGGNLVGTGADCVDGIVIVWEYQ